MKFVHPSFLEIFFVFLKIGAILLGGGYVIVPIMRNELIEKRNWLCEDELCDYYCVSQCLPGIIAINMSILVGCRLLKLKGAIAAIFGISFSPIITILLIASILTKIINVPYMNGLFWGVNLSVIILIYLTLKEMWIKSVKDIFTWLWFFCVLLMVLLKINPAYIILISILLGVVLQIIKDRKNV